MNKYTSVVFDVDSTLVTIEGLVALAERKGLNGEIASITGAGMNGDLAFRESVHRRLSAIRPTIADFKWLGDWYMEHLTGGVDDMFAELHNRGCEVYIVSGSYLPALEVFAQRFMVPIEQVYALELRFDQNGRYSGFDDNQLLLEDHGKRKVLEKIAPQRKIAFIGDGVTDLATRGYVDLFIGFGGVQIHPKVQQEAEVFVSDPDLRSVLQWI